MPVPRQSRAVLDDQSELVYCHFADRECLAQSGDDGCGGLLADAIAQGHVRHPGWAGDAGDARVSGDLARGSLGSFEDRSHGIRGGQGQQDAFGVVDHPAKGDGRRRSTVELASCLREHLVHIGLGQVASRTDEQDGGM